jgi:hypothetical protein
VPPSAATGPPPPANSLTLPGVSSGAGTSSDAAGNAVWTEDANVTAVITATWTHSTGQTDANDPASDGLSNPTDIPVTSYDSNGLKNGESYNSKNAPVTTPPAYWFVQPVSGGTFTFTRTFTAHCVAKLPANATGGTINTSCGFGGYTVKIHAQPYNWHDAGYNPALTLSSPDTTPGGYHVSISLAYSVKPTADESLAGTVASSYELSEDFAFATTVTAKNSAIVRARAEQLRRQLVNAAGTENSKTTEEDFFAMPEAIALPAWQALVTDPASSDFVLTDAAEQLSRRPSRASADLVAHILWEPSAGPETRSVAQAERLWSAMSQMYETASPDLKTYIRSLYIEHGVSASDLDNSSIKSHPN